MKVYNLKELPGVEAMSTFHAMAHLGVEGLVIVSPKDPIASVGYFQDASTSIDLDYCRENNMPVFRREVGGGTVLLDDKQIFYQLVLGKDNPLIPQDTLSLYKKFSAPAIETYREYGIETKYKEVNDLITMEGKKICGEGGANIGDSIVFVGGLLLDFDNEVMSRLFPVKSEEYRNMLLKSLKQNVASMKSELGVVPDKRKVERSLVANFEKILGKLEEGKLTDEIIKKAKEIEEKYTSDEFIGKRCRVQDGFKIASKVNLKHNSLKAVGGTIHTIVENKNGNLGEVEIYGDFTYLPKEKLSEMAAFLEGSKAEFDVVEKKVNDFMKSNEIDSPGVAAIDFAKVLTE